jgi:hypothetical protein
MILRYSWLIKKIYSCIGDTYATMRI